MGRENRLAKSFRDLEVYKLAFKIAMEIYEISKKFPTEEKYSLIDQIRRSSRSVCANIAEGWRKRKYIAMFISKLSDSAQEAAETQVWLEFALACKYIGKDVFDRFITSTNFLYKIFLGSRISLCLFAMLNP